MDPKSTVLDVTSSSGYILSLDYVNTLRSISGMDALESKQYEDLCDDAIKMGREKVVSMHRSAIDKMMLGHPSSHA